MAVYVSTGAFLNRKLPDIVTTAEALGVDYVELGPASDPMADFEEFVPQLEASPVVFSIHNYFPSPVDPFVLNLGALNQETLERSRSHVRYCLGLAHRLGCRYYSVHSAFGLDLTPDLLGDPARQAKLAQSGRIWDRSAVRATFVESLKRLCVEAAGRGLTLLVENNVVSPIQTAVKRSAPLLMVDADEIEQVFEEVGAGNLRLLLDVAHARVSATAMGFDADEFIRRLAPLTDVFHLSDNDGVRDSNSLIGSDAWFWRSLAPFADRDFVIEVYNIDNRTIVAQRDLVRSRLL